MKRTLPPGPLAGPFGMRHVAELRDRFLEFGDRMHREYGDIVHFRLGPVSCIYLFHPDQIQECLVRHARHFKKPERFKTVFGRFQGESVVVADGERWMRQRQLLQPNFGPEQGERFSQIVVRRAGEMLQHWPASGIVDITREMRRLTLGISLESLFGVKQDDRIDQLGDAIETMQQWGFRELNRMMLTPLWMPLLFQPRARKAIRFVAERVAEMIREYRPTETPSGNLLEQLMSPNTQKLFSHREVHDVATTMLVISQETITIALTWTAWLLARHPQIQQSIFNELGNLLDAKQPSHSDLPGLIGVEGAFQESLRLYPPVYVISREVASEVTIGGYCLEPRTQVFMSPYQTQRDPRWFPDPETFDPSRFDFHKEKIRPVCSMIPFAAGPRGCAGWSFATMQARLTIASLLSQYELRIPDGEPTPIPEAKMHLRPRDNVRLNVRRRSNILH